MACGAASVADFLSLPELVSSFDLLGYDVVEMVLADQKVGTDTRRQNG